MIDLQADISMSVYSSFYSTSLIEKLKALHQINQGLVQISPIDLLEAITDGAGGCEQISENGHHLSVLWSSGAGVWYVRFAEYDDNVRSIYINSFDVGRAVEDSHETYARVLLAPGWKRVGSSTTRNSHVTPIVYLDYRAS